MKKILLLLSLALLTVFSFAQSNDVPLKVQHNTTAFGISLTSGQLIFCVDSSQIYALTQIASNVMSLATTTHVKTSKGTNGITGATGATGTNGINGATGATGATGTNGTNGTNGVTGATGATGTDGSMQGSNFILSFGKTDLITDGAYNYSLTITHNLAASYVFYNVYDNVGKNRTYSQMTFTGTMTIKDIPIYDSIINSNSIKLIFSYNTYNSMSGTWHCVVGINGIQGITGATGATGATGTFTGSFITGVVLDSTAIDTLSKYQFCYSQGMTIDTIIIIMTRTGTGSSPDVTTKIRFGTDISTLGTSVVYAGSQSTSYSTATKVYTFNNSTIQAGRILWLKFSTISVKPKSYSLFVKYH